MNNFFTPKSRNRLPSLYSDFSTQKSTNPDGYAVNIAAWERALTNAARHGQIPKHATIGSATGKGIAKDGGLRRKSDHLVLHVDNNLLRDLESPEWGRPVGLGSVFVSNGSRVHFYSYGLNY